MPPRRRRICTTSGRRRAEAEAAFDYFVDTYGVKWDKAVAKMLKDRGALLTFYDFPAKHWKHIRTSNPIESTFATVRHRTKRTKGCLSRKTGLAIAFKLMMSAQKKWRKLDGQNRLPEVIAGLEFRDGLRQLQNAACSGVTNFCAYLGFRRDRLVTAGIEELAGSGQSATTYLPIRRVDMRDGDDVSVDRPEDDQHFASGAVVGRKQLAIRVHQVNLIIAGAVEFRPDDIEKIVWLIGPTGV